jgi:hypothetical protein
MRRIITSSLILLLCFQTSAFAAAPNKYVSAQKSLSYQVLQPRFVGDLLMRSFELQSCGASNPKSLVAIYGEDRSIQFLETDAAVKCSNPGLGAKVATAMINGNKATIVAFCDPANKAQFKKCSTADISNWGGYAMWKVPATKKLHATEVEVLVSGFSYADLLKIARAMSVVGK